MGAGWTWLHAQGSPSTPPQNHDIKKGVEAGRFRRDLLCRINVFTVKLPPLRERLSDVPELARHLAALATERLGRPRPGLPPSAIECLSRHGWPGNVRELANVIERVVALTREPVIGPVISASGGPTSLCAALGGRIDAAIVDEEIERLREAFAGLDETAFGSDGEAGDRETGDGALLAAVLGEARFYDPSMFRA